jgi:hypothetical protein
MFACGWGADYQGPLTLIFDGEGDEWQGLDVERQFIKASELA